MDQRSVVLFDLYGTLVDLETDEASPAVWNALARRLGSQGFRLDGRSLRARFRKLCEEEASRLGEGFIIAPVLNRLLQRNGQPPSELEVRAFAHEFRRLSIRRLELRPYSRPLLERLRQRGNRLALVSNTESLLSEFDIEELEIGQYFNAIVMSSDVGTAKPEAEIVEVALGRVGAVPGDAVFVGDSLATDVLAAQMASVTPILVTWQKTSGRGVTVAEPTLDSLVRALQSCHVNL
jgi:putative hydrolase of the HAD superfamily